MKEDGIQILVSDNIISERTDSENKKKSLCDLFRGCINLKIIYRNKVHIGDEGIDSTVNLSSYNMIRLPSNSGGFSSNLENELIEDSNFSCGILNQITENTFSLGKCSELVKSMSLVINILSSDLENVANLPFASPFGLDRISIPSCLRKFYNLLSTFSSERNLIFEWDAELDIFSSFHEIRCVSQCCLNIVFIQGRECFDNLINRHSPFKHFQNLPNHNSCTIKSRLTMTDFSVRYNIIINLDSHDLSECKEVFKDIDKINCEVKNGE